MSKHGNSHENPDDHHLYEIYDTQENDVFKYGISADPLLDDGSSPRANKQIKFLNRAVGWFRYIGKILVIGISGRRRAEEIEDEYLENYKEKNDRYPRGNLEKKQS